MLLSGTALRSLLWIYVGSVEPTSDHDRVDSRGCHVELRRDLDRAAPLLPAQLDDTADHRGRPPEVLRVARREAIDHPAAPSRFRVAQLSVVRRVTWKSGTGGQPSFNDKSRQSQAGSPGQCRVSVSHEGFLWEWVLDTSTPHPGGLPFTYLRLDVPDRTICLSNSH